MFLRPALIVMLLLCVVAPPDRGAAQPAALSEAARTAPVVVDGVTLFKVRGTSALPAEERATILRDRILEAARDPDFDPQSMELVPVEGGVEIRNGPFLLRGVFNADARLEGVETPLLASAVRNRIARAVNEYRSARSPEGIAEAMRVIAWRTLILALTLGLIVAAERLVSGLIRRHVDGRVALWEQRARNVVQLRAIWKGVRRVLRVLFVAGGLVALVVYLKGVLLALPWTRDAGQRMGAIVTEPLQLVGRGLLGAIPELIVLGLIVALTLFALRVIDRTFAALGSGRLRIGDFDREWAAPTSRMARIAVILLGAVMAYPYIPGSSSEAFRAISIFIGVVLSLGATSLIANALAGNSLIYRRAFKVGERVEVAGVLGDVEAMTAQATYLRTPKNERVTVPNSLVLASSVTNYSRLAGERGLILHAEVGIGYETPWREVETMLIEAARRTPALRADPPPFVLQKRLGDFAPVYEINGYTDDASAAPMTLSALIANVQDVFAEHGVQIMTPNYVGDPADEKVPPSAGRAREAG